MPGYPRPPEATLRWVLECTGADAIISVRRLTLGGWHVNHHITVRREGVRESVVLRRWARQGWQVKDPDFHAHREVGIYQVLAKSRVPAPRLIAADPDATRCDVPAVLLTRLPGHAPPEEWHDLPAFLRRLTEPLPLIHEVREPARRMLPPFRTWHDFDQTRPPSWAHEPRLWEQLIDFVATTPMPKGGWCFIHRDYHPENTLWQRGRLTGIVDWTSASYGPPAIDLATMRANLVGPYGTAAADEFAHMHTTITGRSFDDQPYWDAVVLADLFGEDAHSQPRLTFDAIPRVEAYLRQVVGRL